MNKGFQTFLHRGFSTFHAIIVAFASLYLLLLSDQFKEDSHGKSIINSTSTLSEGVFGVMWQIMHDDICKFLLLEPESDGILSKTVQFIPACRSV